MNGRRLRIILVLTLVMLLLLTSGVTALAETGTVSPAAEQATVYEVAQVTEDWTMWDGITLPVSVFYPSNAAPDEKFPAILVIHGWTLDKTMSEWAAKYYASRGYISVAFTARGWFGAGGEVGCMDPEKDMRDVSCLIDLLEADIRFPLLTDGKGAVAGITGASMGGCFSYMKAPRKDPRPGDPGDERLRAVIPMHGSFDLLFSLYPNGVVKFFWATALLASTYMGNFTGFMLNLMSIAMNRTMTGMQKLQALLKAVQKMVPPITRVTDKLAYIYRVAIQRNKAEEENAKQLLRVRSARYWCDAEYDGVVEHPITAPMLILAGWNDDLFYANEGLMAYQYTTGPKRIIITNHGHLGCYPGPYPAADMGSPESAWVREQVDRWFDRFLKGIENGVDAEPPVAFWKGGAPDNLGHASAYPLPSTSKTSLYLGGKGPDGRGTLRTSIPLDLIGQDPMLNTGLTGAISLFYFQDLPQLTGGTAMNFPRRLEFMTIPYTEMRYTSAPLKSELTIMGPPRFEAFYYSTANFTQLIPWLFEVGPDGKETFVSRGWFEGYSTKRGAFGRTAEPVEMQAVYHKFKAGSRVRLKLATADLITCWPNWTASAISVQRRLGAASRVILPVVPNSN